jgi:hypothetical protein
MGGEREREKERKRERGRRSGSPRAWNCRLSIPSPPTPKIFSPYLLVVLKCPNKYFLYKKKLASRFMNASRLYKKLQNMGRREQMGWKHPIPLLLAG